MIRGIIFPTNVLSAIGIGPDERRRILGVSVALSEAGVHWRGFLDGLVSRGLRGVTYVVSDDHAGQRAYRSAWACTHWHSPDARACAPNARRRESARARSASPARTRGRTPRRCPWGPFQSAVPRPPPRPYPFVCPFVLLHGRSATPWNTRMGSPCRGAPRQRLMARPLSEFPDMRVQYLTGW